MRALVLVLLLSAPAPAAEAPAEPSHRVVRVSEHAFAVVGKGGNVGLYVGEKQAVLVDAQLAPLVPGLLAAAASATALPLELLVNTHHHGDHVGGNPLVAPRVRAVVAHRNVAARMVAEQAKLAPEQRGGLPGLLVGERDPQVPARLGLRLDGLELELSHTVAAHTDGDLVVDFPAERVIQLGDLFFLGILPFVDTEAGGRFDGLVETIAAVAARAPEDAKIIPGHGPVCGRKELLRYRDFLAALRAFAAASPKATSRELAERFDKAAWPEWKPTPAFVTWETLFDAVTGRGPGRVPRP